MVVHCGCAHRLFETNPARSCSGLPGSDSASISPVFGSKTCKTPGQSMRTATAGEPGCFICFWRISLHGAWTLAKAAAASRVRAAEANAFARATRADAVGVICHSTEFVPQSTHQSPMLASKPHGVTALPVTEIRPASSRHRWMIYEAQQEIRHLEDVEAALVEATCFLIFPSLWLHSDCNGVEYLEFSAVRGRDINGGG